VLPMFPLPISPTVVMSGPNLGSPLTHSRIQ
jgi:hypothetical protein